MRFWKQRNLRAPKRDTFTLLENRLVFRYETGRPIRRALIFNTDMRELPRLLGRKLDYPIKLVATSPPYLDTTSFEEDQWLRLWFLGGPPHPTYGVLSPDDRLLTPAAYWGMIADMWRSLGGLIDTGTDIVIRLAVKDCTPSQVAEMLEGTTIFSGHKMFLKSAESSEIRRRQTSSFNPGSKGRMREVDCHFRVGRSSRTVKS